MLFAGSVFVFSLLGICTLFYLKHVELHREHALVPIRERADEYALDLKHVLLWGRYQVSKVPPFLLLLLRYFVREAALGVAAIARLGERQAYRLADLVSYKHRFERKETKSDFLKQVAKGKNSVGSGAIDVDE